MMTIGEVSKMFDLPVSTLRYYDMQGLFPGIDRKSGIRQFDEREIETLRIIECLKRSGLEIKDIKQFMDWCTQGKKTYPLRKELFESQLQAVNEEIARLESTKKVLMYKCWYYEQAIKDGDEDRVKAMSETDLPEALRGVREKLK